MICPRCLLEIIEGADVCPHCKASLRSDGSVQAASAGSELIDIGQPQPPVPAPGVVNIPRSAADEQSKLPQRNTKLLLIAGVCILLCILAFTGLGRDIRAMMGLSRPPAADPQPQTPIPAAEPAAPKATEPDPVSHEEREPAAEDESAALRSSAKWVFEGRVYDMITLKPVRGAQLAFMGGDEELVFTTNARGLYRADLPSLEEGYTLLVDHADYLEGYFDETVPPFNRRSLSRRSGMRTAKPSHGTWVGNGSGALRRDLVLFPAVTD